MSSLKLKHEVGFMEKQHFYMIKVKNWTSQEIHIFVRIDILSNQLEMT